MLVWSRPTNTNYPNVTNRSSPARLMARERYCRASRASFTMGKTHRTAFAPSRCQRLNICPSTMNETGTSQITSQITWRQHTSRGTHSSNLLSRTSTISGSSSTHASKSIPSDCKSVIRSTSTTTASRFPRGNSAIYRRPSCKRPFSQWISSCCTHFCRALNALTHVSIPQRSSITKSEVANSSSGRCCASEGVGVSTASGGLSTCWGSV